MNCSMSGFSIHHQLPEFAHSCPLSQWCHPKISSSATAFSCPQLFPASGSFPMSQWQKCWSFSLIIDPSNEHSGLMSFRVSWLDLLAVRGTLKSLLQCHSSKVSILQLSALFMVQLSHPYMATGKKIQLWAIQTFADKVMSLLFNTLSRFVIAFLPRTKRLNFVAAATTQSDSGAQENKLCHCF